LNGRLYKDDPTIFAWDLINEPRCDCFPDKIPAPPELVSCRPECAEKMQVRSSAKKIIIQHRDERYGAVCVGRGGAGGGTQSLAHNHLLQNRSILKIQICQLLVTNDCFIPTNLTQILITGNQKAPRGQ
jgi:hypothetical protein